MANRKIIIVFVHGWSVTNTNTYGGLPVRLSNEALAAGIDVEIREIFLGRYISFHDEVRLNDISQAFETAIADELSDLLKNDNRFVCITHSTGGPVIRDWWDRYYKSATGPCPMSHLIMLAPANYGSALAQLGKGRISRIKSWFEGVEPGQGVLDWLELGSSEAWQLNREWIQSDGKQISAKGFFPFVLTGQYIDRAFYDNLNSYTGELGSDGVVRVAAANLCGRYIRLVQQKPKKKPGSKKGEFEASALTVEEFSEAPPTAIRIISGKSHSGKDMGIMRSVKKSVTDIKSQETVWAIIDCLKVQTKAQYDSLCQRFDEETLLVQKKELLEIEKHFLLADTYFIHDAFSMIIFKIQDEQGFPIKDYDLILTAGKNNDPNHLPKGFFADRQRNSRNPETITYFFNYNVMNGTEAVKDGAKVIREKISSAESLGFRIVPRPASGFVHYLPCEIKATKDLFNKALKPNSTTLIDIRLRRIVRKNVFRLEKMVGDKVQGNFKNTPQGDDIVN